MPMLIFCSHSSLPPCARCADCDACVYGCVMSYAWTFLHAFLSTPPPSHTHTRTSTHTDTYKRTKEPAIIFDKGPHAVQAAPGHEITHVHYPILVHVHCLHQCGYYIRYHVLPALCVPGPVHVYVIMCVCICVCLCVCARSRARDVSCSRYWCPTSHDHVRSTF